MTEFGISTQASPESRTKASPFFCIFRDEPKVTSRHEGFRTTGAGGSDPDPGLREAKGTESAGIGKAGEADFC